MFILHRKLSIQKMQQVDVERYRLRAMQQMQAPVMRFGILTVPVVVVATTRIHLRIQVHCRHLHVMHRIYNGKMIIYRKSIISAIH